MSLRYVVVALLLLALAAGVGVWQRRLAPLSPPDVVRLDRADGCDLRAGPCALSLRGGGRVSLSITPRDLPPMQPLALEVTVADSAAVAEWIDFVGVDMDMGFNRARLTPAGAGRFRGEGAIPVCVRERMLWEAQVLLNDDGRRFSAPFRFDVTRAGGANTGSR
jgi:hypothetical protein